MLRYLFPQEKLKYLEPQRLRHECYSSTIHSSPKEETNRAAIYWQWINALWYTMYPMEHYSDIKWTMDPHNNMDEPQEHHAKWKKPVMKDSMIPCTLSSITRTWMYSVRKQITDVWCWGGGKGALQKGMRKLLGMMEMVCILTVVVILQGYIHVTIYWIVHLSVRRLSV